MWWYLRYIFWPMLYGRKNGSFVGCLDRGIELFLISTSFNQELTNTDDEYSNRISRLEQEVSKLREENVRIRGDRDLTSQLHDEEVKDLRTKLRDIQQQCGEKSSFIMN